MIENYRKFHELLREMIEKSDYTIYALAKNSGVNRTTLQKVLSGERMLSDKHYEKIIPFLRLTPSEKSALHELYQIEKIGFFTYLRCEYIKNLTENLKTEYQNEYIFHFDANMQPNTLKLPYSCKKTFSILNLIYQMAYDIALNESKPYIYLFSPFDNVFITDILSLFHADKFKHIKITHLIPFIKNTQNNEYSTLYNVRMLSFILPFFMNYESNYAVNYYYEEASLSKTQIPFPYYLVTNHHVLLLSNDYQNALLLDANAHNYYMKSFLTINNLSSTFFKSVRLSQPVSDGFSVTLYNDTDNFSPQTHSLHNTDEFSSIFTHDALEKFCQRNTEKSCSVLNQLINLNTQDKSHFLLVNEKYFHPCPNLSIFLTSAEANIILTKNNICKIHSTHETSILLAIKEFMEHGTELNYFYSIPKSNEFLHNTIVQLP